MAGGPSTPQLCAAVTNAGGVGTLAAGYLTPAALREQLAETAELAEGPWGVNLFCSNEHDATDDVQAWEDYRAHLQAHVPRDYAVFPEEPTDSDDHYAAKLEIVRDSAAAFVSFTFGMPSDLEVATLHDAGKLVVLNVTSPEGAAEAERRGADLLGVQGSGAGGHRATVRGIDAPEPVGVEALVDRVKAVTDLPIIAGGGVSGSGDVATLLRQGAEYVQVGTLFLTAEEAGTKPTHRAALLNFKDRGTTVTRGFSGRWARAIENSFTELAAQYEPPAQYPQLHYLTAEMRKLSAAQGDPEYLNLWAGTGFGNCVVLPADQLLRSLYPYAVTD